MVVCFLVPIHSSPLMVCLHFIFSSVLPFFLHFYPLTTFPHIVTLISFNFLYNTFICLFFSFISFIIIFLVFFLVLFFFSLDFYIITCLLFNLSVIFAIFLYHFLLIFFVYPLSNLSFLCFSLSFFVLLLITLSHTLLLLFLCFCFSFFFFSSHSLLFIVLYPLFFLNSFHYSYLKHFIILPQFISYFISLSNPFSLLFSNFLI